MKSDFGGHHNYHDYNVYAWVSNCWGKGNSNRYIGNTCIANSDKGGFGSDCGKAPLMIVNATQIYNKNGALEAKIVLITDY